MSCTSVSPDTVPDVGMTQMAGTADAGAAATIVPTTKNAAKAARMRLIMSKSLDRYVDVVTLDKRAAVAETNCQLRQRQAADAVLIARRRLPRHAHIGQIRAARPAVESRRRRGAVAPEGDGEAAAARHALLLIMIDAR